MTIFKTPKGTELELMKLKGKDYMLIAQRLLWFNEEVKNFTIDTEFLLLTEEQTICKATVTIYNDNGGIIRKATATKRETKKDFPDHTEKSESSALGRCLSMLGYGTAQALADFDELVNSNGKEVNRLADSPLAPKTTTSAPKIENKSITSFSKKKLESAPNQVTASTADGWE